jgi:hypothetical protein
MHAKTKDKRDKIKEEKKKKKGLSCTSTNYT